YCGRVTGSGNGRIVPIAALLDPARYGVREHGREQVAMSSTNPVSAGAMRHMWAKSKSADEGERDSWHPLVLHLLDVAAVADAVLAREPAATRQRFGSLLGLEWEDARPWLLLLIACHDL